MEQRYDHEAASGPLPVGLTGDETLLYRLMAYLRCWRESDYREVFRTVFRGGFDEYAGEYARLLALPGVTADSAGISCLLPEYADACLADPAFTPEMKAAFFHGALTVWSLGFASAREGDGEYYADRMLDLIACRVENEAQLHRAFTAVEEVFEPGLTGGEKPEQMYRALTDAAERLLGRESGAWIAAANKTAAVLADRGEFAAAVELQEELRTSCAGMDEDAQYTILNNLAVYYANLGMHDKAAEAYGDICDLMDRRYGEKDPRSIDALKALAEYVLDHGDNKAARKLLMTLTERCRNVFGRTDPRTLEAHLLLAHSYVAAGEGEGALTHAEFACARLEAALGSDDPETLEARRVLADALGCAGDREEELRLRREICEAYAARDGKESDAAVDALYAVAKTLYRMERTDEAMDAFHQVYLRKKAKGDRAIRERINILECERKLEQYEELVSEGRNLLFELEEAAEEPMEEKETVLSLLTAAGYQLKLWEAMTKWDGKLQDLRKRIYGDNSREALTSMVDLAMDYVMWARPEQAMVYAADASVRAREAFGEDDVLTRQSSAILEEIRSSREKKDESTES